MTSRIRSFASYAALLVAALSSVATSQEGSTMISPGTSVYGKGPVRLTAAQPRATVSLRLSSTPREEVHLTVTTSGHTANRVAAWLATDDGVSLAEDVIGGRQHLDPAHAAAACTCSGTPCAESCSVHLNLMFELLPGDTAASKSADVSWVILAEVTQPNGHAPVLTEAP